MTHEFVINGEQFPCRDELSAWGLMKLAKAVTSGDDMQALAGMYDLLQGVVLPTEWQRFDTFLSAASPSAEDLNQAIGALMTSYSDRPTEQSSPSQAGPPSTGRGRRVVSLSRGTVRDEEESSTDGAQSVS